MKRTSNELSPWQGQDKRVCRRRCVVEDCPNTPAESKAKCAECSAIRCSDLVCTNFCKLVGRRYLKRCETHSKKSGGRKSLLAKESVTEGISFTQSHIQEAEQKTSTEQAKTVRKYSKGVLEQEVVTSTIETQTKTLRNKLVHCTQEWTKSEFDRLYSGAAFDQPLIAYPAIRVACIEKESVFADAEFDPKSKESIHHCTMLAVDKLRALLNAAFYGVEPSPEVQLSPEVLPGVKLGEEALPEVQLSPEVLPGVKLGEEALPEVQLSPEVLPGVEPSPEVLPGVEPSEKAKAKKAPIKGSLVPLELLETLKTAQRSIYELCGRRETHPLYAIYSAAYSAWAALLSRLADFFPRFDQSKPVNYAFDDTKLHYHQHINDLIGPFAEEKAPAKNPHVHFGFLEKPQAPPQTAQAKRREKNGLPLPRDKEDFMCGLTRSHFVEMGNAVGLSGAVAWRTLNLVNNLHQKDEELYSLVFSAQLMVRYAHDCKPDLPESSFQLVKTLPDVELVSLLSFASPCVSMHRGISDHGDAAARIKMNVARTMPRNDDKTPQDLEFSVHLPHQIMEIFLVDIEGVLKKPVGFLSHYQNARRQRVNGRVRSNWTQMKADTARSVYGIPLHAKLLAHPAFELLADHTAKLDA